MSLYKKARFSFNFLKAIVKKHYQQIFLGLLIGVGFFFLAPKAISFLPKPRQVLKIGRIGQYTIDQIPEEILNEVSFGLTMLSEKGEVLPALADSWEIQDEGRTYRFKIKQNGFVWHDNTKLVTEDINYNFNDVGFIFEDHDLIYKLKEPFAPFLSVVSKPVFKKGLIGLGEYKISKITKKNKYIKTITLKPSDKEDKKHALKIYKFYNSENEMKTAFNLGEINRIENLFDLNGLNLNSSTKTEQILKKNIYLAVLIDNSKPFLEVKSFRQALAYAIPKETGQLRAIGPLNPLSWAYNPDIKPYNFDLERAKNLIEDDRESLSSLKLSLTTFPQYQSFAQKVKESWEKMGITTELKITTFLPSDFDTLLIAKEIPLDPDQYYFWHTTQPGNIINFKNPRIDKLLEDGRKTIDLQARKDIYYDFQRFLSEESPVIFLSYPLVYNVQR